MLSPIKLEVKHADKINIWRNLTLKRLCSLGLDASRIGYRWNEGFQDRIFCFMSYFRHLNLLLDLALNSFAFDVIHLFWCPNANKDFGTDPVSTYTHNFLYTQISLLTSMRRLVQRSIRVFIINFAMIKIIIYAQAE